MTRFVLLFLLASLPLFAQKNFNGVANYSSPGVHWSGITPPIATESVTIQSGTCTIISSDIIVLNNLTINPGANLQFIGNGKILVNGNLVNNGNFNITAAGADIKVTGSVSGTGAFDFGGFPFSFTILGPLNNVTGTITGNSNSSFFYLGNSNQNILKTNYFKLVLGGTGVKALGTGFNVTIADSLVIGANATLEFQSAISLNGHLHNNGALQAVGTSFLFTSPSSTQRISGSGTFIFANLVVNKTSSVLESVTSSLLRVSNQLNLNGGVFRLMNGDVQAEGSINGTFGPSSMIETTGGGLIKLANVSSDLIFSYPLGFGGSYSPLTIGNTSLASAGGLRMKINPLVCTNCSQRSIQFSTTGALSLSSINFTVGYDLSFYNGVPTKLFRNTTEIVTGGTFTTAAPHSFSYNGPLASVGGISGDWKLASLGPVISSIQRRSNLGAAISSACNNERIILVGQNFNPVVAVLFNGSNITDFTTSATGDTLFINKINSTGLFDQITVITGMGNAVVPYTVLPAPNAATAFTSLTSLCSGNTLPITIPSAAPFTTYQVVFNNTILSSASTTTSTGGAANLTVPALEITLPGVYNTRLLMTNSSGCRDTTTQNTPVTVTPAPAISMAASTSKCANDVSLNPLVTDQTSQSWSGGAGTYLPSATATAITYLPTAAEISGGSVSLTLNAFKPGCNTTSRSITVNLTPFPKAKMLSQPDTICLGTSYTLLLDLEGTPPFTGVRLNGSDGTANDLPPINSNAFTQTVVPTLNYTEYTLSAQPILFKDANGCTGTILNGFADTVIAENPPQASISGTINSCQGNAVSIPVLVNGKGPIQVILTDGTVNSSGVFPGNSGSLPISFTPSSSSTISIQSVSSTHCSSGNSSGTLNLVVKPTVNTTISMFPLVDTLCDGETAILNFNTQNNVDYNLRFAGQNISPLISGDGTIKSVPIAFSNALLPAGIDSIEVLATGCTVQSMAMKFALHKSSLANNFNLDTVNGTKMCNAAPVQLSTNLTFASLAWKVDGSIIVNETQHPYQPKVDGNYQLILKDGLSCLASSAVVNVGYRELKPALQSVASSSYESTLKSTISGTQYQWYAFVDHSWKRIVGEQANQYAAYFDGDYVVAVSNGSCKVLSDPFRVSGKAGGSLERQFFVQTDTTITIQEFDWYNPIKAFPNPVAEGEEVQISYFNSKGADIRVELYTGDGVVLRSFQVSGQGWISIPLVSQGLPSGIYFLRMDDGIKVSSENLIVY
ncbi:MAG: T9SS type A sorting domain-containing protein [Cytophagaceae bacterium]|nr:T9SS type A sorting domain-containing protein [Cytophagaceae bacterium]